jgi:hypothetical protein
LWPERHFKGVFGEVSHLQVKGNIDYMGPIGPIANRGFTTLTYRYLWINIAKIGVFII